MISTSSSHSEDPRLMSALEELRAAREEGLELSRDEFLARHPEFAEALGPLYDTLSRVSGRQANLELETVGNYQILGERARGGMGVIYQAIQLDVGRLVALKVLVDPTPQAQERFRLESAVAARLHHTNIVPVFGAAHAENVEAYAMPYLAGPTLAEILSGLRRRGEAHDPIGEEFLRLYSKRGEYVRRMVELAIQAADALAYAHREGVLHRDVKPANMLLEQTAGSVHLWLHDFGLARVEWKEDFARPGQVFGTRGYQSPEQAEGRVEAIDARSDVYSMGATLFEMLALKRPEGTTDLRRCEPTVPADLAAIVSKCLAKSPGDRYSTAEEFAEDLRCFLHDYPVKAGRSGWSVPVRKWSKRHRRPLLAAVGAFCIAALIGGVFLVRSYQAERAARELAEERYELLANGVSAFSPIVDDLLLATPEMREKHVVVAQKSYEIHEKLLVARPDDLVRIRQLASVSWRLSRVLERLQRYQEAESPCRRSMELYQALCEAEPKQALHRLDLTRSLTVYYGILNQLRDKERSQAAADRMLAEARKAAEDFPEDRRCRDALATYTNERAQSLMRVGELDRSEALYREGLKLALAEVNEDFHSLNPVLGAWDGLAKVYESKGDLEKSVAASKEALSVLYFLLEHAARLAGPQRAPDLFAYTRHRLGLEPTVAVRLAKLGRFDEAKALLDVSRKVANEQTQPQMVKDWINQIDWAEKEIAKVQSARKTMP